MMENTEVEFVSVCNVFEDSLKRIRLFRIADIENQTLTTPYRSSRQTSHFENRDTLYQKDGPSEIGTIGVWRWTAIPNQNNPESDYIHSSYVPDFRPVRIVIVPDVRSVQEIVPMLLEGKISSKSYICDTLFCAPQTQDIFSGILCKADEFHIEGQNVFLENNIYTLPCYSIKISDIYNWDDRHLRFLKTLCLHSPEKYVAVGNIDELIYSILSDRMSWRRYKDCIGKTKAEWKDCKAIFQMICEPSLYEEVAEKTGYSLESAKTAVDTFIQHSEVRLNDGDVDADILSRLVINHDTLRTQCEKMISHTWEIKQADKISEMESKIDTIKQKGKEIAQKYKSQIEQLETDKQNAEKEKEIILEEITEAQKKLNQLVQEIEQEEKVGSDTVQAIRNKISMAQKDMAGFLAEAAVFLPQLQTASSDNTLSQIQSINHWAFYPGTLLNNKNNTEECTDWSDILDLLRTNLQQAGVGNTWVSMLAAFLYASYLNHVSLILAGPNAESIANAVSLAVCGKTISVLKCYGEKDEHIPLSYIHEKLFAIENPFHPDWLSSMTSFPFQNHFTIWLHPFTEDLQLEPKSLFHYVFPIFTECFVEQYPSLDTMIACENPETYAAFQSDIQRPYKSSAIKKMGLSCMDVNRFMKVLADAERMEGNTDAGMEYLFGILPFAVLHHKQDVILSLLEEAKDVNPSIRTEIEGYIEE